MPPCLAQLFLLSLLACDWAGDPHCGRSPLSRPLGSQEVSCHTLAHRQDCSSLARPAPLAPSAPAVLDAPACRAARALPSEWAPPSFLSGPDLLYTLMVFRR